MTYDLSHLPVSVRPQAFNSAEDRIRQIHTAHWVGYPRADLFLSTLSDYFGIRRDGSAVAQAAIWRRTLGPVRTGD